MVLVNRLYALMERWALVSGLCGDLDLDEQIQFDLKRKHGMAHLFVLGDMVSPDRNCYNLLSSRQPKRGDLVPNCIYGWWEEQLLAVPAIEVNSCQWH